MNLAEIIEKLDKSHPYQVDVYDEDLVSELQIANEYGWYEQEKLVFYTVSNWYCTDSEVGLRAYFFENVFVAMSNQTGRKCSEEFEWVSFELFQKVREYVLAFHNRKVHAPLILDLEKEMGNGYRIDFTGQLFQPHKENCFYQDEPTKIVEIIKKQKYDCINKDVMIKHKGKNKVVSVEDLIFSYNIKKTV